MSSFWIKAQSAAESARLLLDAGHGDGAVNRAYFAMYFAARSTLERLAPEAAKGKRHATLIGRFAQHVVRGKGLDPALGRNLNLAFDQRLIADYEPELTSIADAKEIIADMAQFLTALATFNDEAAP